MQMIKKIKKTLRSFGWLMPKREKLLDKKCKISNVIQYFYKSWNERNTPLNVESNDTLDDNPLKVVYTNECNLQGGTHSASLLTLIDCHGQIVTWCMYPDVKFGVILIR